MFDIAVEPDYAGFLSTLRREGTPDRVHVMELFVDPEVQDAIADRFGPADGLDPSDRWYLQKRQIRLQRFLGYDFVAAGFGHGSRGGPSKPVQDQVTRPQNRQILNAGPFALPTLSVGDTALDGQQRTERLWADEHHGLIASWKDFEQYPWPDPETYTTEALDWYSKNLPDDMCLISGCHQIFEHVTWLMSYEGLSFALYDQPDLVDAVFERVGTIQHRVAQRLMAYDRVKILFGGDDMGFRTGTMVSPGVLIEKVFPWHRKNAELAHAHGKLYLLHSCGKIDSVMSTLIEDVGIDGRHSFEDTIEPVTLAKQRYGDRIALIGGIDVDLLARGRPNVIRKRVREVLEVCQPGGGYCLGSGNSITNYMPLDNYLTMLDEGRQFGA